MLCLEKNPEIKAQSYEDTSFEKNEEVIPKELQFKLQIEEPSNAEIILERYKELMIRLHGFPKEKLEYVTKDSFLKSQFGEYVEDHKFMIELDPDFQSIVSEPILNLSIVNDVKMLPEYLRYQMLQKNFPDLDLLQVVTEEKLPRHLVRNPNAGCLFTISPQEVQILDASRVLMVKVAYHAHNKVYTTTIELDFLMAHDPYSERCLKFYENIIREDMEATTQAFEILMENQSTSSTK